MIQVNFLEWDYYHSCFCELSTTPHVPGVAPVGAAAVTIWVEGLGETYWGPVPRTPEEWQTLHAAYAAACAAAPDPADLDHDPDPAP